MLGQLGLEGARLLLLIRVRVVGVPVARTLLRRRMRRQAWVCLRLCRRVARQVEEERGVSRCVRCKVGLVVMS